MKKEIATIYKRLRQLDLLTIKLSVRPAIECYRIAKDMALFNVEYFTPTINQHY